MNDEKIKCPVCNGKPVPDRVVGNITFTNCKCEFCHGKKNINWLEAIFGVNPNYRFEIMKKIFDKLYW